MAHGPRALVLATFAALTVGFMAGYGLAVRGSPGGAPESPHPVGAEEHRVLGMRALQAGDFAEAERRFREAVGLRPRDPAPHADLAVALMYGGRWEEAERELALARRYGPGRPEVHFLEGILARDALGDTARARAAWRRFLAMVPDSAPQARSVRQWLKEMETGSTRD